MAHCSIPETELVKTHGIRRDILARLRREGQVVQYGPDWRRIKKVVCYSEEGACKIAAKLGKTPVPPVPEPPPLATEDLQIVKANYPNRQMVQAKRASGELVFVRVRSSANYAPFLTNGKPMMITATQSSGRWVRVGRDPRYKGRW